MRTIKYRQAVAEAIGEEMERDASVVLFGEDVARAGGTFAATAGLLERFGEQRVRDTPISESVLVGLATGAAMTGLRPIVEIMFFDFLTLAADQLVNHAAKVSSVSGGTYTAPIVLRTMSGAARSAGPQHAQSLESWIAHVPGLKVVMPANAADLKGLLKAAVRDPDPVVVVESLALWGAPGEVPEGDHVVPIGTAALVRSGDDVTLVSWGSAVPRTLEAADLLAAGGITADVLDLRTISPLDEDAVLRSLAKTGRLAIVHDAVGPFGGGAEIAAIAACAGFESLTAPVVRLTAPFAPPPLGKRLEQAYYPQPAQIVEAVRKLLSPRR